MCQNRRMPKTPITSRTLLYKRLSDSTIRILDWTIVTVSLGVMVESRCITRQSGAIQNEDLLDSSCSDVQPVAALPTGNYALDQLAYASAQWPHYRDDDPTIVE